MEYEELMRKFAEVHEISGLEILDGAAALDIDGMRVAFLHDEAADALLLLGEIGLPPPGTDGRLCALLMQANYLFRGSDGATFSQNPETKAYALLRSLPLALLDAHSLAAAIQTFANTLERWRRLLADYRHADLATDASPAAPADGRTFGESKFISV